jgi:hypothetical protein
MTTTGLTTTTVVREIPVDREEYVDAAMIDAPASTADFDILYEPADTITFVPDGVTSHACPTASPRTRARRMIIASQGHDVGSRPGATTI